MPESDRYRGWDYHEDKKEEAPPEPKPEQGIFQLALIMYLALVLDGKAGTESMTFWPNFSDG